MNKLEETFLRLCLKPGIECNLPGRLRLSFGKYRLLPKEAAPYLHYIRDVLRLLPGVSDAEINPRIGTVLIRYDTEITSSRAILKGWTSWWTRESEFRRKTCGRTPTNRSWKRSCASA